MPFSRSVSDARDLRALARKAAAKKKDFGKMFIYFGCRNSRMDHIYKEELEKCKMSGALDEVYVAFSRDKEVMEKVSINCRVGCNWYNQQFNKSCPQMASLINSSSPDTSGDNRSIS